MKENCEDWIEKGVADFKESVNCKRQMYQLVAKWVGWLNRGIDIKWLP